MSTRCSYRACSSRFGPVAAPSFSSFSSSSPSSAPKDEPVEEVDGHILGVYSGKQLTAHGQALDAALGGRLQRLLDAPYGPKGEAGEVRVLCGFDEERAPLVALAGLGAAAGDAHDTARATEMFESPEQTQRAAYGEAARALRSAGATRVLLDPAGSVLAAAEGARMGLHRYDDLKTDAAKKPRSVRLELLGGDAASRADEAAWDRGVARGEAVCIARALADTPANHLTPAIYAQRIERLFADVPGVRVVVHDEAWVQEQRMGLLWAVAKGSDEPPRLVEIHYDGLAGGGADIDDAPIAFVGKGVTFDSGGIDIKPAANMGLMRGDMGGSAAVVAALWGIAKLNLRCRVIGVLPLAENMPSGRAIKPADVVVSRAGLTVEIDNTDAEGRLLLADALTYVQDTYMPSDVIDVATLTGAIDVALGAAATGFFTNCQDVWEHFEVIGRSTGELFWKMPLLKVYEKDLASDLADIKNCASGRSGGACTAAAFLHRFVTVKRWAHLDIAGGMHSSKDSGYTTKGMTGIPTRSLIAYAEMRDKLNRARGL
jgi:aminopeptidase